MKAIKKLTAIVISMAMLIVLAIPAFAAVETDGQIQITNAVKGHTYTIYRILDSDANNGTYLYTKNDKWGAFIDANTDLFDVASEAVEGKYYVTLKADVTAAQIAAAVETYLAANTIADDGVLTADATTVTFEDLEFGYYYVATTVGSVAILDNAEPAATIAEKNAAPYLVKQTSDSNDETLGGISTTTRGGEVDFTITVTVPAPGATDVSLFDVMETGLTLNADSILVNNAATGAFAIKTTANSFQIDFEDSMTDVEAGATIVVTYTATLAADATIYDKEDETTSYKNVAYLKYGDLNDKTPEDVDPEDEDPVPEEPGVSEEDKTETRTFEFGIDKIDGTTGDKLGNVGFTLNGGEEVFTGADGALTFTGLQAGTYTLAEKTPLTDYNKIVDITVVIAEDGTITFDGTSEADGVYQIANYKGTVLPETGAMGTIIFSIIGGGLICVAVVLMVTRKKMSVYED